MSGEFSEAERLINELIKELNVPGDNAVTVERLRAAWKRVIDARKV
jgi:hypothetical protein